MKDEDASRIVNEQEDLSPGPRRLGREKNPPMYHHDEYAGITTVKHTVTLKEFSICMIRGNQLQSADAEYGIPISDFNKLPSLILHASWTTVQRVHYKSVKSSISTRFSGSTNYKTVKPCQISEKRFNDGYSKPVDAV
ncbi:Hypothetical predicted protein [Paramuricea clavata]|uniref:Uncharacterized protein n=1 Tax=Paramuricea clavata TaxID=317549 RepID=A0A6S7G4C2_PARCT|nr:Hypothetical predicted protein [Paramuricea clavata]